MRDEGAGMKDGGWKFEEEGRGKREEGGGRREEGGGGRRRESLEHLGPVALCKSLLLLHEKQLGFGRPLRQDGISDMKLFNVLAQQEKQSLPREEGDVTRS